MSQNITLLGASYTDVPSVLLPKTGGGTAQFDDTTDANAVASDILSGKTAYVNGTKLVGTGSGGSATTRYITLFDNDVEVISDNPNYIWINNQPEPISVGDRYRVTWKNTVYTVTAKNDPDIGDWYGNTFGNAAILGGEDDPSDAPFVAYKTRWSTNEMQLSTEETGTFALKIEKIVYGDNLNLQSKTITTNGTYTADSGYDALESVTVNVSGSGNFKKGSVTISQDYTTTGNRTIVSLATIGFTPKQFYMWISDKSAMSGKQYTILRASFESDDNGGYIRSVIRYSNTSNSLGASQNVTNWTTQTNYHLYNDGTNIYYRTTTGYNLFKDSVYNWVAVG